MTLYVIDGVGIEILGKFSKNSILSVLPQPRTKLCHKLVFQGKKVATNKLMKQSR